MSSRVIKFVAGAGKTTHSVDYMKNDRGGVYLAFTNSVVADVREAGCRSLTIDSLFASFLIPKMSTYIPLITSGSRIEHIPGITDNRMAQQSKQIRIEENGSLFNRSSKVAEITLKTPSDTLRSLGKFSNSSAIKYIFSDGVLRLSNTHVQGLAGYLIANYSNELVDFMKKCFSFVIIDEAQDLKGYREAFAQMIYKSDMPLILLGDSNQNVNGGGQWFEDLAPDETKNSSYRCADGVCEWIRDNLGIEIYGTNETGSYEKVQLSDIPKLDDGERKLLYAGRSGRIKATINNWSGPKGTIKSVKGETIHTDVVIVGGRLNVCNLYTAITRTKKSVYSTVESPSSKAKTVRTR